MKKLLFFILPIFLLSVFNQPVFALTAEQRKVIQSGIYYFNTESCSAAAASLSLSANEAEKFVFWRLVARGLSLEQAAGVMGNMWVESGVNPKRVQHTETPSGDQDSPPSGSIGYGLVQWTPGTKILGEAQAKGKSPSDIGFQTDLLLDQLEGLTDIPEKAAGDALKQESSPAGAAASFMNNYERPKVRDPTKRIEFAERVYQTFAGQAPPEGVVIPTSSGSSSCTSSLAGSESIIDGFVIYSQYDPAWANAPYGSSTVAEAGCGPSSIAMIVSSLTTTKATPKDVAQRFGSHFIAGTGSDWGLMTEAPEAYGLNSKDIGTDISAAAEALRAGSVVIATGQGPKPFTVNGHVLVLRGITKDGKILVGDSGHKDTSTMEWDPTALASSIRNMWVVSK